MKQTLLQMVQDILSESDSDPVNSIADTEESEQAAVVIKNAYFDLIIQKRLPEHKELTQLTALGDSAKPNYLKFPSLVTDLITFKYDKRLLAGDAKNYEDVHWLEPDEFIERTVRRDSSSATVDTISDFSGVPILVANDKHPQYWTSFDDEYIVCDSYLSTLDATLQASKTLAYVRKYPAFTVSDSFTPDMDEELFPLLLAEAKSNFWSAFKGGVNQKVEQTARRNRVALQSREFKSGLRLKRVDYGRS